MTVTAACHIHSQWSYDGKWSLPELAAAFSRRGYRVLMVTEHDRGFSPERIDHFRHACSEASSSQLLVLPGIEYSDRDNRIHVLVWGQVPFLGENLETINLLAAVKTHGGVSVLAHPSRREAWKRFDPKWNEFLLGIEVWNRKTDGWSPSPHAPHMIADSMIPFVGMDFHTARQMFPLAMRLTLSGPISESVVLDCLRSHRCSPTAFGRPLESLIRGPVGAGFRTAERCRRILARSYRNLKK
jgi:hypothetical protein